MLAFILVIFSLAFYLAKFLLLAHVGYFILAQDWSFLWTSVHTINAFQLGDLGVRHGALRL